MVVGMERIEQAEQMKLIPKTHSKIEKKGEWKPP